MDEDETDEKWWSVDSNERSINKELRSLDINSNGNSKKGENSIVSRGNPAVNKPQCSIAKRIGTQKQKITSQCVLSVLKDVDSNLELSKSSGYCSVSPTTEIFKFIPATIQNPIVSSTIFENDQPYKAAVDAPVDQSNKSTIGMIKKILILKLRGKNKSKSYNSGFILDFDDTKLIKCCRQGQLSGVQEAINELAQNHQLGLIDHQNAANETALSIATYQMNEAMIKLLFKYDASPCIPLSMNNNVLHLAAAMTNDFERRTLKYLVNAIKDYKPELLLQAVTDRNIYSFNVCDILQRYRDMIRNDPIGYHCIQDQIVNIQHCAHTFYEI